MNILILGAGGHGQTVADAVLRLARIDPDTHVLGFLDDTPELQNWRYQDIPVIGPISRATEIAHDGAIVAIGDNRARRDLFLHLHRQSIPLVSVIHPTATVALDVDVGPGCYIGANVVIGVASRIGVNAIVSSSAVLGHHNRIGAHAHIGPGVNSAKAVSVGTGTLIGIGAILYPGCSVGAWSQVAGGSLVARDIGDSVLAVGSPARSLRRLDDGDHAGA